MRRCIAPVCQYAAGMGAGNGLVKGYKFAGDMYMDRDAILNILNRYQGSFGQKNLDIDIPIIIVLEAQRLSEKDGKDVLGSDDLQKILMIGRCKALELLNDNSFPTLEGLNKVSMLGFVIWMVKKFYWQL